MVAGRPGPVRNVVILNAAAALVAYGKPATGRLAEDFSAELGRAQQAIDSGAAQTKLTEWIEATQSVA
jgi:anthranilate phosphoribosyltransferase